MRRILICGIALALLVPYGSSRAQETRHPLKAFIEENSGSPERVSEIQSNKAKRWGKVLLGGVIGATAGYIHAQQTGGDVGKEMAIGAVAGSAAAFAITKIQDRRLASREEVATLVSYDPSQGYRSGVQQITVTPDTVQPGGTIKVTTSYWALGPTPSEEIGMSRYAGISISGAYLRGFTFKPNPMKFGDGGGQFETTIEIQLPPEVSPGTYNVSWLLDGYSLSTDSETTFVVSG